MNQVIRNCRVVGPWGDGLWREAPNLTPLQIASQYCTPEYVQALISFGAYMDYSPSAIFGFVEHNCSRPAYIAVMNGRLENLEVLIRNGAEYGFEVGGSFRNLMHVAITASDNISNSDYPELNMQVFPLRFWAILCVARNFQAEQLEKLIPIHLSLLLFGKPKAD